jgi:signal peptidase I
LAGGGKWSIIKLELKRFFTKHILREILIIIVLGSAVFFIPRATLQTYEVFQSSMEPNFYEGQWLMVNKAAYWFGNPERGDVVICKAPNKSGEEWIKRIIALPGDTVRIDHGVVYINGVQLVEPYVQRPFNYSMDEITVPPGNYFFLGDNRNVSNDSHLGWFMAREGVIGKAWLVTWPPSAWGSVPAYPIGNQVVLFVPAT